MGLPGYHGPRTQNDNTTTISTNPQDQTININHNEEQQQHKPPSDLLVLTLQPTANLSSKHAASFKYEIAFFLKN
jgi:hypothetical protein